MAKKEAVATKEVSVEERLRALFDLQQIDSRIDRIRTIRGELPLEVEDLEDEIGGLETRLDKLKGEMKVLEDEVSSRKLTIKDSQSLIKKYEQQQMNVRNSREFDSISKEIEFQTLEIQLAEKKIKEAGFRMEDKKKDVEAVASKIQERKQDLDHKKSELDDIVAETQKEEDTLVEKSSEYATYIEDRLLSAYNRIRKNAANGLAVVTIERDACGGCFAKIPPQRQLDIAQRKKIIVCEHCGRLLVDVVLASEEEDKMNNILKA
jgi:predicted  nucleic acid-binding Zn-ribbon protein